MSARELTTCIKHKDQFPPGEACPSCAKEFRKVPDPFAPAGPLVELPAGNPPASAEDQAVYNDIAANYFKDTNPKDAVGIRKLAFSVLPWQVLVRVALGMLEGALKYGRHNYRASGVRASVYFDALMRHITDWWEGTDIDPDSKLHHIDKAITTLMVMRDSMLQGNFVDDRPPRGHGVDMAELNRLASELHDRHADKNPRHYTITDSGSPHNKE